MNGRILQYARNAIHFVFFIFLFAMAAHSDEPLFNLVFTFTLIFIVLTLVDTALLINKTKNKLYFYLNSIFQLFLLLIIVIGGVGMINTIFRISFYFGELWIAALISLLGIVLSILNIAIIISLKKSK